jgi:hypothetical protein
MTFAHQEKVEHLPRVLQRVEENHTAQAKEIIVSSYLCHTRQDYSNLLPGH